MAVGADVMLVVVGVGVVSGVRLVIFGGVVM